MAHHLEGNVELEKEGVEQDEIAYRQFAGYNTRNEHPEGDGELGGERQPKDEGIAHLGGRIAAECFENRALPMGKLADHPAVGLELAQRIHRGNRIANKARAHLGLLDGFIQMGPGNRGRPRDERYVDDPIAEHDRCDADVEYGAQQPQGENELRDAGEDGGKCKLNDDIEGAGALLLGALDLGRIVIEKKDEVFSISRAKNEVEVTKLRLSDVMKVKKLDMRWKA